MTARVALVTGASGAIGSAVARALAEDGLAVAVHCYRNRPAADALAGSLPSAAVFEADVRDEGEVSAAVDAITDQLGPPLVLVNNAGVLSDAFLQFLKADEWDRVVDTSLKGAFLCSKHVLRGMTKARWGRIINVSSVAGVSGDAARAHYAAAKAGMLGLTKSLAREVARGGITVNAVCPGLIESPMTEPMPAAKRESLLSRIPAARFGLPEEVAAAVRFLASESASYITGSAIMVDGGLAM